ncbi:MAG: amidase [Sphingomonas sp.]
MATTGAGTVDKTVADVPVIGDWDRRAFLKLTGAGAVTAAGLPGSAMASDIVTMGAAEQAAAIRSRKLSAVELMRATLDHVERVNPKVNAIVALRDRAALLDEAAASDRELARGGPVGVLHGLPHAVKDLQPVKGLRTTFGSPIFRDNVPAADGLMVARLRQAGVIFIGKTNTPEFGLGSNSYNAVYGVTRNAWDQTRSAGGSTGGGAVALALRMTSLADGSDYAGSLRNPTGWNNVCGFRTSIGRVPNTPDEWLPSMGVQGPAARTVADLALLLSVQAGVDSRAPLSMESPGAAFAQPVRPAGPGKRIGWLGDFGGDAPIEPEVQRICDLAMATLRSMKCTVEPARPDFSAEAAWTAFKQLRSWQQGGGLLPFYDDPAKRPLLKPEAVYEIEAAKALSAFDITRASSVRSAWSGAFRQLFDRFDFLIAPTAQMMPFTADIDWPKTVAGKTMQTYHEWMKGVCLVTLSGCPSLAVPAGFGSGGLPMGLQIIGPVRRELACLEMGAAFAAATGFHKRMPPLIRQT